MKNETLDAVCARLRAHGFSPGQPHESILGQPDDYREPLHRQLAPAQAGADDAQPQARGEGRASKVCKLALVAILMTSPAFAGEAEWTTDTAWSACRDITADAGQGLRGSARAFAVYSAHWDCIAGSGFRPTFKCPICVGCNRVPPPACWEPVPIKFRERQMWLEIQREYHPHARVLR
jgi:hypothetical protein